MRMYKNTRKIQNISIPVPINNTSELLLINELNLELTALDSLTNSGEALVISSLLGSAIVGTYCKTAMYLYMYHKIKDKKTTPIDLLLLANAIIQHIGCLVVLFTFIMAMPADVTFSNHLNQAWCNIPWYSGIGAGAYRTIGSLGIAIFRLLYIKYDQWVEYRVGKMRLMSAIMAIGITLSASIAIGFGIGNGPASRKQVFWNWCMERNEEFREVVSDYGVLSGTITPKSEFTTRLSLCSLMVGNMFELGCYVIFFRHIYIHDSTMLQRNLLSPGTIKKRHQKNAITFLGQFYGFVIECSTYMILMFTLEKSTDIGYRLAITIAFWIEFGVMSLLEVIVSPNLTRYLPHNYRLL